MSSPGENLFSDLTQIEQEQKNIEEIENLRRTISEKLVSYRTEFNTTLKRTIALVREKIKANEAIKKAVETYTKKYVALQLQGQAREELYDILSAELLQNLQDLRHITCTIL